MNYTVLRAEMPSRTGSTVLVLTEEYESEGIEPADYFLGSPLSAKAIGEVDIVSSDPDVLLELPACLSEE